MAKPKEDPQWMKDGKAAAEKRAQERIKEAEKAVQELVDFITTRRAENHRRIQKKGNS